MPTVDLSSVVHLYVGMMHGLLGPKPVLDNFFSSLLIPIHSGLSNNMKAREKKLNKDESSSLLCRTNGIASIRIKSSHASIILSHYH
jgi:hypothetical protein